MALSNCPAVDLYIESPWAVNFNAMVTLLRALLDRYAVRCVKVVPAVSRVAVLGARSAPKDTDNQPRGLWRISRGGAPWLVCLFVPAVMAQAPALSGNDAVFRYRGADRDARLIERAKREGTLVLYTSLAPTESQPLGDAFQKKYGVKVELWRGLSDQVVQRAITEARARRNAVDVIETNGPEMEMLAREKLLGEISRRLSMVFSYSPGIGRPLST